MSRVGNSFFPTGWFWLATALMLSFLLIEIIADLQQWDFYQTRARFRAGETIDGLPFAANAAQGFLSLGLFRYSRHPNYFGELGFWLSSWLAYSALIGTLWNIAALGPGLLIILFIGSTIFTEAITAKKYPDYAAYQKRTSPIVPWFHK
jgi:steroid 5-alpha reductase family enzyme